jgi:hypothetical protein
MAEQSVTLNDVYLRIGQMEGKLDATLAALTKHINDDEKVEERVAKLEKNKAWLLGAGATLSAIVSAAYHLIAPHLK